MGDIFYQSLKRHPETVRLLEILTKNYGVPQYVEQVIINTIETAYRDGRLDGAKDAGTWLSTAVKQVRK